MMEIKNAIIPDQQRLQQVRGMLAVLLISEVVIYQNYLETKSTQCKRENNLSNLNLMQSESRKALHIFNKSFLLFDKTSFSVIVFILKKMSLY